MAASPQRLKVAIVGGGIGGLTLALAIQHFCDMLRLEVHVYEAAARFSQIGAGINIWGRVHQIFAELGLEEEMTSLLRDGDSTIFTCRRSDQPEGVTFSEVDIEDGKMLLLHRADVQDILLKHISSDIKFHFSHRLKGYSHVGCDAEQIELSFRDGQTTRCDMLIAADGVRSAVRPLLLQQLAETLGKPELRTAFAPVFSGTKIYRGLVTSEKLAEVWPGHPALTMPFIYCGKNKHVVTYPISRGEYVNVVAFYSDMSREDTAFEGSQIEQATTEEVLRTFQGWEPMVRAILGCMHEPSHWAIITQKPLDTWAADGVFLLGDAAHAMTPHIGAGAGQAIEDAYVLARIIAHAQRKDPLEVRSDDSAHLYNRLRPPIANYVQARARLQRQFYEFNGEDGDTGRSQTDSPAYAETDRLLEIGRAIWDGFHWQRHTIVRETDEEVARALGDVC
ncbi:hypothetical protein HDZ31DRAFT_82482 [Schizophyllum fasciatum]